MRTTFFLWMSLLAFAVIASVAATAYYLGSSTTERVIVSTTTSLYDTGLLAALETEFEAKHAIDVNFISIGTGIAIHNAQRGDADLILVHSPPDELGFLTSGTGVNRKIIAYNFFVIVGPKEDPAEISNATPLQALAKIVEKGRGGVDRLWVSRGDNSGTHAKEKSLWEAAGLEILTLTQESWYVNAGSGMGETLKKADHFGAYTLADIGTYLKYEKDGLVSSVALVEQAENLLNVYTAVAVNNTLHPRVNLAGATTFMKFLISPEGQELIQQFGKAEYGRSLFVPAVSILRENTDPAMSQMIEEYAFLGNSECPPEYRKDYPELYE
jgi:tungstate transport system substrate-binding protein